MDLKGKRVILGSNSPRRRELLAGLNIDFEVDTKNDFNECFRPDTPYDEVPRLMSVGKSHGFHRPLAENEILITADTMVILPPADGRPGEILGKPKDREDAIRMLRDLSGREHHVTTAVTVRTASSDRRHRPHRLLGRDLHRHHRSLVQGPDRRGDHLLCRHVPALRQGRRLRHPGMDRPRRHHPHRRILLQRRRVPHPESIRNLA